MSIEGGTNEEYKLNLFTPRGQTQTTAGLQMLPFGSVIDAWLRRKNKVEQDTRKAERGVQKKAFYASELGYGHRKIFLSFFPEVPKEENLTGQNLRVFANGEAVQNRYSEWFKAMGIWVAEEVPLNTYDDETVPVKISGRIDLIIDYYKLYHLYNELVEHGYLDPESFPLPDGPAPKEGELAIIEMKSINSWGFKEHDRNDHPEPAHIFQLTFYQWRTGIHVGFVFYEEKDRQQIRAFPVRYDERLVYGDGTGRMKGLLKEFTELGEAIENRVVPPKCPSASQSKFPCKWGTGACAYYNFCWNSDETLPEPTPANVLQVGGMTITLPEGASPEDIARVKAMLGAARVEAPKPTATDYVAQMKAQVEAFDQKRAEAAKKPAGRKKGGAAISESIAGLK